MENFNTVSSHQNNRFMMALGNHPFQNNNEARVSKLFVDVYQRNSLILLIHTIIEEMRRNYTELNNDLFSVM